MSDVAVTGSTGVLLDGRYRLLAQIGRGSMGSVHRARDELLGRYVAVKLISTPVSSADDLRRDKDEVKVLARLNHHSLVTLFDAGSDFLDGEGPRIFLVMELIEGPDLRDRISQGPLPTVDVAQIGQDMARALDYVHDNGVVHRDVKPANIMMFDYRNDTSRVRAKLTDFGIAVMTMAPPASDGSFVGTAAYVSPEQAKGEELGPASDIYSLGLVLLECLTGVVSYPGEPLTSALARLLRDPDIPADLDPQWIRLLAAMTATDPAARPSAGEAAMALEEITVSEKGPHRLDPSILPPDEVERMKAVDRYQILDTPPDGAFDRITALAARIFAVPIAIVSVVDHDRIWFKSHHGVEIRQIDRDPDLCASAILQDQPWIIHDATSDPRALSNPLVANGFGLQFYAGIPLRTRDGYNLGTICVMDLQPRTFRPQDIKSLEDLAAIVMNDLELRLESRRPA